ncbi:hypothetical protein ABFS83_09G100100 [Erythranthe nasuta]
MKTIRRWINLNRASHPLVTVGKTQHTHTYRKRREKEKKTMPKNTDAAKSKIRSKSTRKPLRDVSNAKTAIKSAINSKKTSEDGGGQTGEYSLDNLLLVHSDLSSLMRQIDELVVQALNVTSNKGRQEVKQFADVLSDIQNSLKPWVPRFQKALLMPESKSEQSMERNVVCEHKEESTNAVIESPIQTKWESLVSPSPLVSWRAECNTEGGRQLFLLTPLPQKTAFSSKYPTSSIRALEDITFDSARNLDKNLAETVPDEVLDKEEVTKAVGDLRTKCVSPEKFSKTNCSMFVMTTPCLKMSPPKSCILLEPISAFSKKKNKAFHKSTPFPSRVEIPSESLDSESSSSQSSDDSKAKYPEIFGIKTDNLEKKMAAQYSPSWIVSPPKTCAIMEPSDEKLLKDLSGNQEENSLTIKELKDIGGTVDLAESTPMIKVPVSSFRIGKHPGENTLKKELWTRFEAASTYGTRFDGSVVEDSTTKGFLDKLEEVFDA